MHRYASQAELDLVRSAGEQLALLLARFERDVRSLGSYRDVEPELARIEDAVRLSLIVDRKWAHEAARIYANAYRRALAARIANPAFYQKPTRL